MAKNAISIYPANFCHDFSAVPLDYHDQQLTFDYHFVPSCHFDNVTHVNALFLLKYHHEIKDIGI